jgi:hypothetical protein
MAKEADSEVRDANTELERLAQEKGVKPLNLDELLSGPPLGQEDEPADMTIEEIYTWRRQGSISRYPCASQGSPTDLSAKRTLR